MRPILPAILATVVLAPALAAGEAPKPAPKPGATAAPPAAPPAAEPAPPPPPGLDAALARLLVPDGQDPAKAPTKVSGFAAKRVQLGRLTAEQWARLPGKVHAVSASKPFTVTYQFRRNVGILIVPDPGATWSSGPGKEAVDYHGSEQETLDDHARMALLISGNDSPFEPVEGVPLRADDGDVTLTLKANDDSLGDNTGSVRVKFIWVEE